MEDDQYVADLLKTISFKKRRFEYLERLRDKTTPEFNKMYRDICLQYDYDSDKIFAPHQQHNNDNINENHSDVVNMIYKKLSLLFHPDKTDESNHEIMVKINEHYRKNDFYELLMIATKYQIKFVDMEIDEYIFVLEKKIYKLDTNIKEITNSQQYSFMMDDKNGMDKVKIEVDCLIKTTCKLEKSTCELKKERDMLMLIASFKQQAN